MCLSLKSVRICASTSLHDNAQFAQGLKQNRCGGILFNPVTPARRPSETEINSRVGSILMHPWAMHGRDILHTTETEGSVDRAPIWV